MSNPLLDDLNTAKHLPDVSIGLPTRGLFYEPGEVIREGADLMNLQIRPISILEETALNDPLMLISGQAVARLVKSACPDVMALEYMCDVDVQALLIGARIASHGPTMIIKHTCTGCPEDHRKEQDMQIDLLNHINKYAPFDQEFFDTLLLELPDSGQMVMVQPITYGAAVDITKTMAKMSAVNEQKSKEAPPVEEGRSAVDHVLTDEFLAQYADIFRETMGTNIDAITGAIQYVQTRSGVRIYDRDLIREWYLAISGADRKKISGRIEAVTSRLRDLSKIGYVCDLCETENEIHLELDPQRLFTVAESSETVVKSSAESKTTAKATKPRSKASQRLS